MTALVLSGSFQETRRFAQQEKLGHGIRHITSRETMTGIRPNSIHILPSFYTRRDRHALNAELKHVQRRVRHVKPVEYDYDRETKTWSPRIEHDTSKDAVPGQIPIEEVLEVDIPATVAAVREENPGLADAIEAANPPVDANELARGKVSEVEAAADADDEIPEWMREA